MATAVQRSDTCGPGRLAAVPGQASPQILLVLGFYGLNVSVKGHHRRLGQHCDPVFTSLRLLDRYFPPGEVEVLDPQAQCLVQPQPAAIEQLADQQRYSIKVRKNTLGLLSRQNRGNAFGSSGPDDALHAVERLPQYLVVQEQDCRERLEPTLLNGTNSALLELLPQRSQDFQLHAVLGPARGSFHADQVVE